VWQLHSIEPAIKKSVIASTAYFLAAWNKLKGSGMHQKQYNAARNEAIVTLTNVSDSLQQMLAEPHATAHTFVHQFVIASHMLTSRISALSKDVLSNEETSAWADAIVDALQTAAGSDVRSFNSTPAKRHPLPPLPALHPLSIIYSLTGEIKNITGKIIEADEKRDSA
jgi:hypothetical protein